MRVLTFTLLLCSLLLNGCASLSGNATRSLTAEELDFLSKLQAQVKKNNDAINQSLTALGSLYASKVEDEHSLKLSVSKAKLLESMRAPWTTPPQSFAATQRAVVLYHLYDLAEGQQALIDARIAERRAALRAVSDAYGKLDTLLGQAIENEKLILAYLNQPATARISAATGQLLAEINAFRDELAQSNNTELQALAQKAGRASERVDKAKDRIDQLLEALTRAREK